MRDLYFVQAVEDLTECKTFVQAVEDLTECKTFAVFCRLGILSNIWNKSRDCTHIACLLRGI